jgi:hypothetical protein
MTTKYNVGDRMIAVSESDGIIKTERIAVSSIDVRSIHCTGIRYNPGWLTEDRLFPDPQSAVAEVLRLLEAGQEAQA